MKSFKSRNLYQFSGKNIVLISRRQLLPNGLWKKVEMVSHPGAVCIAPFLNSGKIVLIRQYRPAPATYLYELPAGTLDENEDPLTCARRELKEETGYTAKYWTKKGKIFPLPAYSDEQIIIYKATGLKLEEDQREEDEIIETMPVTLGEVRRLFSRGKIIDAKTICALAFCGVFS